MKINWHISLKSIPELSDLPYEDRKKLWRQCALRAFHHWQTWLALFGCIIWGFFISVIAVYVLEYFPNANAYLLIILEAIIGTGIGLYIFFIVLISIARPYIKVERKL